MSEQPLKPGWTPVKFGDVVRLNTDRIATPAAEGIERYVGLEHITPEDLRIRSWGLVEDGTTFTNYFQPGQVLFGKRRAYQRKVAVADFSGVCSGDIYVFEPQDPAVLLPELLPFICQTERFYQHAVGTSAGSLSPRTNWTQLAQHEFPLPPLAEQRRLAEVLWAANEVVESLTLSAESVRELLKTELVSTLDHGSDPFRKEPNLPDGWSFVALGELIDVKHGYAFTGQHLTEKKVDAPIVLIPKNFTEIGELSFTDEKIKRFTGPVPDDYWLHSGELVLLMTDLTPSARLLGAPGIVRGPNPVLHNQRIGLVQINDPKMVKRDFLFFTFLGEQFRRLIRATSTGSTVNHTSPTKIKSIRIPLPPLIDQERLIDRWSSIYEAYYQIDKRSQQARKTLFFLVQKSLTVEDNG